MVWESPHQNAPIELLNKYIFFEPDYNTETAILVI